MLHGFGYDLRHAARRLGRSPGFVALAAGTLALGLGVALVLSVGAATVGLYGVVSGAVSRRTREIGVRMALGARPGHVLGLVLREAALIVALGVGGGALAAAALARFARGLLFEVSPLDPLTFAATTAGLGVTALAACVAPARRAARVDPVAALRRE